MASRRIVSAPVRTLESSNNDAALIETLCVHPDVRIVSFVAAVDALPPSPAIAREQAGTLASTSRLQRTIAVGSCRIYKAPGSVAFISCGAALQPILPKSQCWAIDEHDCTFALQIRRPTFWRIELPSTTEIDLERAKTFRETLSKILQFERTPCPFQRGFTIELPEEPDEPVKKIPWTPKRNGNDYRPVTAGAALGGNPDWTPPDADLALRSSPKSEETHTKRPGRRRRSSSFSQASFATPGEACFTPTKVNACGQDQDPPDDTRNLCRSPSVDFSNPAKLSVGPDLPKTIFTKTFGALIAPPTYLITLMLRIAAQLSPPPQTTQSTHGSSRYMHMPGQWDDFGDELSE
ncbi:uncharacterized protein J7T54_001889 [Emericellopsis cladophorae]|uniref:Inheritance of peroxisomes protein 1 n=1 Tax=Emericellopsis cladophorae TaxID=2686198 RepID=A0A9P9XX43_9HYPO|nr:uncharacterized protein J7T54_001889 [Emericellopsis cladophorae]KAI6779473.1 hypothetical protein J7T54_001889 [Emericellopsis cladophorae]